MKAHAAASKGRWYVNQARGHYRIAVSTGEVGFSFMDRKILRAPPEDQVQSQDQVFNDMTFACEAHAIIPELTKEIYRVKSKAALYELAISKMIEEAPPDLQEYLRRIKKKADSLGAIKEEIEIEDEMLPRFALLGI